MRYLLDSDSLIAAKNLHYQPSFCQGFWEWINEGNAVGKVFSIDLVYKELLSGNESDFLNTWSKDKNTNGDFFLSTKNCMSKWAKVTQWAQEENFKESALNKFLDQNAADAWLIAFALSKKKTEDVKYTIVTNEVSAPNSKSSIKLPDAASAMGVPVIKLYDLLNLHAEKYFNFKS